MTEQRRFGTGDLAVLLIVLAAAAGTRFWYVSVCADQGRKSGPVQVQEASPLVTGLAVDKEKGQAERREADVLVENLNQERWFGSRAPLAAGEEKTAHVAPGYYWLLFWLEHSPVQAGSAAQTARWLQAGLGTLTAVIYFLFALQAFGSRLVAGLTGLLCAAYPFWIINTAEIQDGVLATFLLAVSLYLGASASQRGGAFASLLYGLALAGLALVRAALLPFALVALLWFLLRCRFVRRGWLCALLAFLGFVNCLASWTIRNYQEFGDIVPVADSTFLHLWEGNNGLADGGAQSEQTLLKALAQQRQEQPPQTLAEFGKLKQKERYDKLAGEVWKYARSNREETFNHRLESAVSFFLGARWLKDRSLWHVEGDSGEWPDWVRPSLPGQLLFSSLFLMLSLAALGWRWTYGWRQGTLPSSLALVWVPLPYILGHAEDFHGPRLPIDGILLCYAAFALVCLVPPLGATLLRGAGSKTPAAV